MGALREQSLTHVKERVALKAILDDKVRALISDIGQSVAELPIEVRRPGRARSTCPPARPQHTLTVTGLRRVRIGAVSTGACGPADVLKWALHMDPVSAMHTCVPSRCIRVSAVACPAQVRQHPKLLRQVLALDKLVGATVKALSSASASAVHSS